MFFGGNSGFHNMRNTSTGYVFRNGNSEYKVYSHGGGNRNGTNNFYEEESEDEEVDDIFKQFFRHTNVNFRRQQPNNKTRVVNNKVSLINLLIQMIPMIFLAAFLILPNLFRV